MKFYINPIIVLSIKKYDMVTCKLIATQKHLSKFNTLTKFHRNGYYHSRTVNDYSALHIVYDNYINFGLTNIWWLDGIMSYSRLNLTEINAHYKEIIS